MKNQRKSLGKLMSMALHGALVHMPASEPIIHIQSLSNWRSGLTEHDPHARKRIVCSQATRFGGKCHIEEVWFWADKNPLGIPDRVAYAGTGYRHKVSPEDHMLGQLPHLDMAIVQASKDIKRTRQGVIDHKCALVDKELAGSHTLYLNVHQPQIEMLRLGLEVESGDVEWGAWIIGYHWPHCSALEGPGEVVIPDDDRYEFLTEAYERFRNTSSRLDEVPDNWGDAQYIYDYLATTYHLHRLVTNHGVKY